MMSQSLRLRYQRTHLDEPSFLDVIPANHEGSMEVELAYTVVSNGPQKGKEKLADNCGFCRRGEKVDWTCSVASVTRMSGAVRQSYRLVMCLKEGRKSTSILHCSVQFRTNKTTEVKASVKDTASKEILHLQLKLLTMSHWNKQKAQTPPQYLQYQNQRTSLGSQTDTPF